MTTEAATDVEQLILDLQGRVRALEEQLDAMRGGVAGRQMLDRGAMVSKLGSVRTDTAGVRPGTQNDYVSGSTIIKQEFDGTAWRAVTLT